MKCYNHHDRDAFGVCRACGKALCLECIEETEGAVACKNNSKCKELTKATVISLENLKNVYYSKNSKKERRNYALWLIVFAIICIFLGINWNSYVLLFVGLILIVPGLLMMIDNKKIKTM